MSEIIKDLAYVIIVVVLSLVSHYLIPYLKRLAKEHLDEETLIVIERAVRYAEQTVIGEKKGKEKLNMVQMYVSEWLKKNGIEMDAKELNMLIESAVYIMKNEPLNAQV